MTDASIASTQPVSAPTGSGNNALSTALPQLSLTTVNRVLGLLTVLAVAFFVVTLLAGLFKLAGVGQHIRSLETKGAKAAAALEPTQAFVKSAAVDPALGNRNIFQPAGAAVAASGDAAASGSGVNAYRLVGISAAKDPAETYVMIENSQSKLTYFLQYNQPVEGLELEKILEDKVIVKIGGKSVEFE